MGTIDDVIFRRAGARGSACSDYNLVKTECCQALLVEDSDFNDVYFDPKDLTKVVEFEEGSGCPICAKRPWKFEVLPEWPRERTDWMWAYHPSQAVIDEWIKKGST